MKKKLLSTLLILGIFCIVFQVHAQYIRNNDIFVELSWTCDSYTPAGYEGKALPTKGSVITVSAMPYVKINGKLFKPDELNYQWMVDDEFAGDNKPYISFTSISAISYSHEVRVIVNIPNSDTKTQEWITINRYQPKTVIYEYDGQKKSAKSTHGINENFSAYSGNLTTFLAVPFFFNTKNTEKLSYKWQIDGSSILSYNAASPQIFQLNIGGDSENYIERTLSLLVSEPNNALTYSLQNILLKINEK